MVEKKEEGERRLEVCRVYSLMRMGMEGRGEER